MKLRVKNNSIRLRLTQGEVATFSATGECTETIEFGISQDNSLKYSLKQAVVEDVCASFECGKITVLVPKGKAENWVNTNTIGIEAVQQLGTEKKLKILIEKDFACIERRDGEDDNDAFPHPDTAMKC